MQNKDLYYQKYLKYKNKYLNLQNLIGGTPDISITTAVVAPPVVAPPDVAPPVDAPPVVDAPVYYATRAASNHIVDTDVPVPNSIFFKPGSYDKNSLINFTIVRENNTVNIKYNSAGIGANTNVDYFIYRLLQSDITTIILKDFLLLYRAIFNVLLERQIKEYTDALNNITKIRFIDNDLFEEESSKGLFKKETIDKLIRFIALFKNISKVEIVDKTTVLEELQKRGLKNVLVENLDAIS